MSARMAHFPRYEAYSPHVPVWCATPGTGRVFHRFFDTSPFSPSGRYLALTRLPFEDRMPGPGDVAEVVLVDLSTGEERVVAESRGWDTQLGAQVQWGADDSQLFFNDLDTTTWRPYGVVLDPATGATRKLEGTVYMVSPDGRWAASPCLRRTGITQAGYGVLVPPEHVPHNHGASAEDGLYVTDTASGERKLIASFEHIVHTAMPPLEREGIEREDYYGFHVKWNATGDRLMLVLRWISQHDGKRKAHLITMQADGSDVRLAIPASLWNRGGHHPNWCPDGDTVMMNLKLQGDEMRFVRARYDGSDLGVMSAQILGSGHPSLHPDGRSLVTDAYLHESLAYGDGTTPIRFVDLKEESEITLARIRTLPPYEGPKRELRVDPHPAWDRTFRRIAFNACPDGTRRVYVADLSKLVG